MRKNKLFSQRGFTLVEVLTVMLVLVALASITVESTKDFVFQGRYDVTKDRYEKIKKAIIGDPNQVINGQPNIEGFVKDLGRLPTSLNELKQINFCKESPSLNETDCGTQTKTWITKSYISGDISKDGWGNDWEFCLGDAPNLNDKNNTCFEFNSSAGTNQLAIQSKGKDGVINSTGTGYDEDYPKATTLPSIKQTDWMVNVNGIQANIMASSIKGSCAIATQPTDPATCQLAGRTWNYAGTPPACAGIAVPISKVGCESVSGVWEYDKVTPSSPSTPTNLCVKITQFGKFYKSENTLPTISENGREQLISFANLFFDVNDNGIKDAGEVSIQGLPLGKIKLGIYTPDCTSATKYNDPSSNRLESELTLYPNTTLPTINW